MKLEQCVWGGVAAGQATPHPVQAEVTFRGAQKLRRIRNFGAPLCFYNVFINFIILINYIQYTHIVSVYITLVKTIHSIHSE